MLVMLALGNQFAIDLDRTRRPASALLLEQITDSAVFGDVHQLAVDINLHHRIIVLILACVEKIDVFASLQPKPGYTRTSGVGAGRIRPVVP
jgi:hypothetical protein